MNIAEAFQNFVSKITGQTDRIEAATSKLEALSTANNETASENTRLKGEVASLNASLAERPDATALSAVTTERDAFQAAINDGGLFSFENLAGGKPTLSLTDAGKAHFVNPEVSRVLAQSGHEPLPVAVDSATPENGATKVDPKLTGRDRIEATYAKLEIVQKFNAANPQKAIP